ncbi:protein kinase family protein [Aquibacillus kalidii]|uniref:protein kinase family protein n=1 Tax=Aquibacillus kalidii TaxID=2762597 RepID=UPI00164434E7|nr:protein kinase family protein [Aquibacillus kalidii]
MKTIDLVNSVVMGNTKQGVIVKKHSEHLTYIGTGRSAAAFRVNETNQVLKVFLPEFIEVAREEAEIYKILLGINYYPTLYEYGENFLLIDYIAGNTLFDCLASGIPIKDEHIKEVDSALHLAKQRGLNPSDIHLRNILLTDKGDIKLVDVARFRQTKQCQQWSDLKQAFYSFYNRELFPKKIPLKVLNMIAYLYKRNLLHLLTTRKNSNNDHVA